MRKENRNINPSGEIDHTYQSTMVEINYWTNGKICAKVAFSIRK